MKVMSTSLATVVRRWAGWTLVDGGVVLSAIVGRWARGVVSRGVVRSPLCAVRGVSSVALVVTSLRNLEQEYVRKEDPENIKKI